MAAPATASWAERAGRWSSRVETALLALLVMAMVGLAGWQILMRNLGGSGLTWADEALRIMVLWVTMIGAVAACREQRHVSIDALSRYLPRAWQPWIQRVGNAFAAVICAVLAWASWQFLKESVAMDDRLFAGQVPAWSVQLILPLAFGLLTFHYAVACLRRQAAAGGR